MALQPTLIEFCVQCGVPESDTLAMSALQCAILCAGKLKPMNSWFVCVLTSIHLGVRKS